MIAFQRGFYAFFQGNRGVHALLAWLEAVVTEVESSTSHLQTTSSFNSLRGSEHQNRKLDHLRIHFDLVSLHDAHPRYRRPPRGPRQLWIRRHRRHPRRPRCYPYSLGRRSKEHLGEGLGREDDPRHRKYRSISSFFIEIDSHVPALSSACFAEMRVGYFWIY
jgi:hypothetical protein